MREQPVAILHQGETLIADVQLGGTDGVILLPGWGGTRYGPQRILQQTAQALAARGFTTVRIDFRGRGDSSGDATTVTLDAMIADACAVADWLRTTHAVTRLHLVGICSGANVALGAASLLPDVGQVVCWSILPFMEHKAQATRQGTPRTAMLRQFARKLLRWETWRKLLKGEANLQGAVRVLATDKEGDSEERRRKTSQRDILADLQRFSGMIRLLYGSSDPEAAGSQAFFTDWCRRHRIAYDVHRIDGAPHNFYTARWTAAVVAQTTQWLCGE